MGGRAGLVQGALEDVRAEAQWRVPVLRVAEVLACVACAARFARAGVMSPPMPARAGARRLWDQFP